MFNFHKDHKSLANTSLLIYIALSMLVSVLPALDLMEAKPLPSMEPMTAQEQRGLEVYVAENCMACHTQQVRNIEMDKMWGDRPSIPSDYYYSKQKPNWWQQSPSLLGSERTGPDLTSIGDRRPGRDWHLLHFYNPRIVVEASVMPSYPWFYEKKDSSEVSDEDVVVPIPKKYLSDTNLVVTATQELLDLIAYLNTLKQASLENPPVAFIPSTREEEKAGDGGEAGGLDGEALYMTHCSACHQANGKGVPGAFPPLDGSPIVNDENPEKMIKIILMGYDARAEYAVMTPFADILSDEEIAAIATHERSSWSNDAPEVTVEKVKEIRKMVETLNQ